MFVKTDGNSKCIARHCELLTTIEASCCDQPLHSDSQTDAMTNLCYAKASAVTTKVSCHGQTPATTDGDVAACAHLHGYQETRSQSYSAPNQPEPFEVATILHTPNQNTNKFVHVRWADDIGRRRRCEQLRTNRMDKLGNTTFNMSQEACTKTKAPPKSRARLFTPTK